MNITEIRVKLVGSNEERLRAFCSVTLDGAFVIRDLKVIDGSNGPFVAMPSRKLSDKCPHCGCKNHLRAKFCNECGGRLDSSRAPRDGEGRVKLHADVAHPINAAGREVIQREVIAAYERELEASRQPGYRPAQTDDEDLAGGEFDDFLTDVREAMAQRRGGSDRPPPARPTERPPAPASPARTSPPPAVPRREPPAPRTDSSTGKTPVDRPSAAPPPRPAAPAQEEDPFSAGIL